MSPQEKAAAHLAWLSPSALPSPAISELLAGQKHLPSPREAWVFQSQAAWSWLLTLSLTKPLIHPLMKTNGSQLLA